VEIEVLDVAPSRSRPDRGIVTVRNVTRNQSGDELQILVAKLVVPSRLAVGS
jgi:acyl dehydratase